MLKIAIVQSRYTGEWHYCPEAAREKLMLNMDTDPGFGSSHAAVAAAASNAGIRAACGKDGMAFVQWLIYPERDARNATPAERAAILRGLMSYSGMDESEALETLEGARIAMFDSYTSDGPGYCGKVALVLFSGGPDCVDTYTWRGDVAERLLVAPANDLSQAATFEVEHPDGHVTTHCVKCGEEQ